MQRLFAAVLAVACVVGSTPGFARGGGAHSAGFARGGVAHGAGLGNGFGRGGFGAPRMHVLQSRIPAPLAAPAEAPIINGPLSQPAFRGLTGIGQ
jgi:hypothetical protein